MTDALPCAIDTESELIAFDRPFPKMVSTQWAAGSDVGILHHTCAEPTLEAVLDGAIEGAFKLVMHSSAFDLGVIWRHSPHLLPKIFAALDGAAVSDTLIREQLLSIADGTFEMRRNHKGSFSLGTLAQQRLGIGLDKGEDSWRLRYGELIDVPVAEWPREARDYATADAATTLKLREAQGREAYGCPDEPLQVQSAWALALMTAHGVVTDEAAVDRFELRLLEEMARHEDTLKDAKIIRTERVKGAKVGSKDTKVIAARIEAAYMAKFGRDAPKTPTGKTSADGDTLDDVADADPVIGAIQGWNKAQYYLGNYAEKMRMGPYDAIRADFRNLVESGRTSSGARKLKVDGKELQHGLNWQNLSRDLDGGRECVVARPGNVLVCCDYSIAELRALAQVCFTWLGWSKLREAIAQGLDPHALLAGQLMGLSAEEAMARKKSGEPDLKWMRDNVSKHMNFGFAGGMGPGKFCKWVRGATNGRLRLEEDRSVMFEGRSIPSAKELKASWMAQWAEMRSYFRIVAEIVESQGWIEQFGSKRRRGNVGFTDAANGLFQGYVGDVAKRACYLVTRACYVYDPRYPNLYGCRPILFIHDEVVIEAPEGQAPEAAAEMRAIMEETEGQWMPDVPPEAEAKISRRWRKQSKVVFGKDGRLAIWEDPLDAADAGTRSAA